jgi:hypothetical protein
MPEVGALSNALYTRYAKLCESFPVEIVDLDRSTHIKSHAQAPYKMYHDLRLLANGNLSPGSLAIGRIYLFDWKKFFGQELLYKQVMWLLRTSGTKQQSWIAPTSRSKHDILIATRLDQLTLHESDTPNGALVESQTKLVNGIKNKTNEAKEYLRTSTITELAGSLHLAGLIAYGEEIFKHVERDGFISEQGDDGLKMGLVGFLRCTWATATVAISSN